MDHLQSQVQLVSDLLSVACEYGREGDEADLSQQPEACQEAQGVLGGIVTFIAADGPTKKQMAIEWGDKIEDVAEGFWGRTEHTIEKWGDRVEDGVDSVWGDVRSTFKNMKAVGIIKKYGTRSEAFTSFNCYGSGKYSFISLSILLMLWTIY